MGGGGCVRLSMRGAGRVEHTHTELYLPFSPHPPPLAPPFPGASVGPLQAQAVAVVAVVADTAAAARTYERW